MADIVIKNISKKWDDGKITAVSDVSLEIKDGEIVVLVGPSGCGKTTLLRMIAGIETITEGELYIGGKLMNDVQPKDRNISMVYQNFALFPQMTVYENIAFGLIPLNLPEDEVRERVEKIAAGCLNITHLLDRKPKELSGGQKQRVAFARALVNGNSVVVLDEPLSNVDERLNFYMRTEILKLHKIFGVTFIYVTHHIGEAMAIADRMVMMDKGKIKQVDTPQRLYSDPANIFAAGFMCYPQMNFWTVKLAENDGDVLLNFGDEAVRLSRCNTAGRAYMGKEVYAGIRAEHMYTDEENLLKYKDSVISAEIITVEFYGSFTNIHFNSCGGEYKVTVPGECGFKSNDRIKIALDPDKIYLFDMESEDTIYYK